MIGGVWELKDPPLNLSAIRRLKRPVHTDLEQPFGNDLDAKKEYTPLHHILSNLSVTCATSSSYVYILWQDLSQMCFLKYCACNMEDVPNI